MTPELTPELYAAECAIRARADAWFEAHARTEPDGWRSLSAEDAAHPDYAACNNDMRGRLEQFEILTNPPENIAAYLAKTQDGTLRVCTWTGHALGTARAVSTWRVQSAYGSTMSQYVARIAGREYTGRGFGEGMFIRLRETAASRRKPRLSEHPKEAVA